MKKTGRIFSIAFPLALIMTLLTACPDIPEPVNSPTSSPAASQTQPPSPSAAPAADSSGAPDKLFSSVFVQKNTDGTDGGFFKLLASMEKNGLSFYERGASGRGIVGARDVVLLKINSQWAERGGTNTDLLKSVIEAIAEHPDTFKGEIIVADNGQAQYGSERRGGSLDWKNANSKDREQSARDVVDYFARKGYRVSGVLWDTFTTRRVSEFESGDNEDGFVMEDGEKSTGITITYAKFTTKYGTKVSFKKGIWNDQTKSYDPDALKVINMPVLKSHAIYQVTGAVKHYMGTTSDKLTKGAAHDSIGKGSMGTQMAGTRYPALTVMDAIWVAPAMGPSSPYSSAAETDTILAGLDPVALDWWASKNILMAAAKDSGNNRSGSMDPDGTDPGTFGYWLRLAARELQNAGYPVTMDKNKIMVYITE